MAGGGAWARGGQRSRGKPVRAPPRPRPSRVGTGGGSDGAGWLRWAGPALPRAQSGSRRGASVRVQSGSSSPLRPVRRRGRRGARAAICSAVVCSAAVKSVFGQTFFARRRIQRARGARAVKANAGVAPGRDRIAPPFKDHLLAILAAPPVSPITANGGPEGSTQTTRSGSCRCSRARSASSRPTGRARRRARARTATLDRAARLEPRTTARAGHGRSRRGGRRLDGADTAQTRALDAQARSATRSIPHPRSTASAPAIRQPRALPHAVAPLAHRGQARPPPPVATPLQASR